MKAAISIFAALLIVVVNQYAHADDLKITKPKAVKATNGAQDPEVEVTTRENPKKQSVKISVDDFKDFSEKSLDDRVVEFRRGNEYYTMIPLSDFWFTKERKEAFEVSQTFGEKLMKVWMKKTLNLRFGQDSKEIEAELTKLTSDQIRELLKQGGKGAAMPTAREIVEAAGDAREAVLKLKDRAKFNVEFDELIRSFDQNQEEIFALRGLSSVKAKMVPKAFMFVASVKVPTSFLEALKNTRYLKGLSVLLKGSVEFTVTVRPWKVVKRNLDTGVQTTSWYLESATQTWLLKDLKTDAANVSGPLRLGAGLLWGDFDRMGDINGFVSGYSKGFNFQKTSLNGALAIPSYTNVKMGAISAVAETLTQGLDIANFVKNGYFMMTRQYGFQAPMGRSGHWDVGGVFNLANLTDKVTLNQDTLEELLQTVASEVPGAEVIVREDQVEILLPADKAQEPTQEKKETSPTPDAQQTLKGQDNVPHAR